MKISLQNILNDRDFLVSIAEKLGLINLRIYRTSRRRTLTLLVDFDSDNSEASSMHICLFADYLANRYKCQLKVTNTVDYSDFREDINQNPPQLVSIKDLSNIQSLFNNQSLDKIEFDPIQIHEEDALMYESQVSTSVRLVESIVRKWDERQVQSVALSKESESSIIPSFRPSVVVPESDNDPEIKEQMQQTIQKLLASQNKPVSSSMWQSPKSDRKRKIENILEAVVDVLYEYEQGGESSGTEYWLVTVLDTQKNRLSKKRRMKETP